MDSDENETQPLLGPINGRTVTDYGERNKRFARSTSPHPRSSSQTPNPQKKRASTGRSNDLAPNDDSSCSQRRRYSFSGHDHIKRPSSVAGGNAPERPLYQRLLSNYHSVSNPNSPFDAHLSSVSLIGGGGAGGFLQDNASIASSMGGDARRMSIADIVNSLRPQRLIGTFIPICNWYDAYISDLHTIKNKKIRNYYEEQNELIEKFQEIDNFLDAGKIHYNMLSNYTDSHNGKVALDNIVEIDEPLSRKASSEFQNNSDLEQCMQANETIATRYSRFYDVPGNIDNDGSKFLGFDEEDHNSQVLTAILVNFLINFLLLIGKLVVAVLTNSISVVASLVDSILDFLSTFIIYVVNRLATTKDWKVQHTYPVGRSRLEPLGILIFSIIIIISFFQVGQESFKRLFFPSPEQKIPAIIGIDAIAIMTTTIIAKVGCWLWCSKSPSSSVQALAQDAMTDIVFNTVSLLMPAIGHYFDIWWFDPLGALLLSVYIVVNWSATAFEHINNLTGAIADPRDFKVILYLAYRFAEPISRITALKIYHVGDNLNVEIDLVFAEEHKFELSFKDCHDIAEALQYSIESLPMVERAFVHIDYMEGNYKGHLK
ncbi:uncharacterized protein J8A68_003519 [[Candida] subhashii]|uniref:Cation efflux protein transmembrane domain-containing protein n=1 Tax=[Candida] subhashii TaxID=561895 RepID=A0A8J5Q8T2_9ASCO|nr:uncharacterized protein J8A68_003519 [[Candida] subhashii]KAG7662969.1 hypothetical protein J8A68_003519 [[Candida] subhashii]